MTKRENGPCEEVYRGGVGESGATSTAIHKVKASMDKMMVIRRGDSSLCPNTGAAAMLLVNGVPQAIGDITDDHASIQAYAPAGATVVGIVHTYPRFNDVVCVRLGELHFTLEECDLVGLTHMPVGTSQGTSVTCYGAQTKDWYAWNNLMPPKPDDFHAVGQVQVANPGVEVELVCRGQSNGTIQLSVVLYQRPGIWPQVLTWKEARYDRVLCGDGYKKAEIYCGDDKIADLKVDNIK